MKNVKYWNELDEENALGGSTFSNVEDYSEVEEVKDDWCPQRLKLKACCGAGDNIPVIAEWDVIQQFRNSIWVYAIQDRRSCKIYYVGCTRNIQKRANQHLQGLSQNTAKYVKEIGRENLVIRVLKEFNDDEEAARQAENHYIKELNTIEEGWNTRLNSERKWDGSKYTERIELHYKDILPTNLGKSIIRLHREDKKQIEIAKACSVSQSFVCHVIQAYKEQRKEARKVVLNKFHELLDELLDLAS